MSVIGAPTRYTWRVVDLVVAAVLGIAVGVVFTAWNVVGYPSVPALHAAVPGLGGLTSGVWLLGGVIGGLIIRKPGAAILVELVAAVVSMAFGNLWGVETVLSGLAQGLGAELVFAVFAYRRFALPVAVLSGMGAALGAILLELFIADPPNITLSLAYNLVYLVSYAVSGAVLAGLVGWLLTRALAATGVLDRFAAGRARARDV